MGSAEAAHVEPATVYEIVLNSDRAGELIVEMVHDNPEDVIRVHELLIARGVDVSHITRNSVRLDVAELRRDLESYKIKVSNEADTKLRPAYRPGKGSSADYGETGAGRQALVWRPLNPEDRFD